ncbi:MAG: hypothetical protein AB9866_03760 [Syntrophobacteraceae bacterium]
MAFLIMQGRHVSKQLKALSGQGGNAMPAAEHAKAIIKQLVENGFRSTKEHGRLTRYGEARIKNCIKFDLVNGYRLVGVLGEQDITFLFVGSHAECDHWISNNAGLDKVPDKTRAVVLESKPEKCGQDEQRFVSDGNERDDLKESEYDSALMPAISDGDLRRIFSGLVRQKAKCKRSK